MPNNFDPYAQINARFDDESYRGFRAAPIEDQVDLINIRFPNLLTDYSQQTEDNARNERGMVRDTFSAVGHGAAFEVAGMAKFLGAESISNYFQDVAENRIDAMSDAGREAFQTELSILDGDKSAPLSAWWLQTAGAFGQIGASIGTGGVVGAGVRRGAMGLARAARGGDRAQELAGKTGTMVGIGGAGGAASTGQAIIEAQDAYEQLSWDVKQESPMVRRFADEILEREPEISDEELINAVDAAVNAQIGIDIRTNPTVLAVNFGSSFLADNIVAGAVGRRAGSDILNRLTRSDDAGPIKRAAGEAVRRGAHFTKGAVVGAPSEIGQDVAIQRGVAQSLEGIDPNADPDDIDWDRAAVSAVLGGVASGGVAAATSSTPRPRLETGDPSIDEAAANLSGSMDRMNQDLAQTVDSVGRQTRAAQSEQTENETVNEILEGIDPDRNEVAPTPRVSDRDVMMRLRRYEQFDAEGNVIGYVTPQGQEVSRSEAVALVRGEVENEMRLARPAFARDEGLTTRENRRRVPDGDAETPAFSRQRGEQPQTRRRENRRRVPDGDAETPAFSRQRGETVYGSQDTVDTREAEEAFDRRTREPGAEDVIPARGREVATRNDETWVQADVPAQPTRQTENESIVADAETVQVPVDQLQLSEDVPQFKGNADAEGVVEPLQGDFDDRGVAPIAVWERADGRLEVISGRHRLDLARRSGRATIRSQVFREADGFEVSDARALDAELNIRDNQGETADYARYFREAINDQDYTEQDAQERGLLRNSKGDTGWRIAQDATEATFSAYNMGRVSEKAAAELSRVAPRDEALQNLGLELLQSNRNQSVDATIAQVQAMQAMALDSGEADQGDMFGYDDSQVRAAEDIGRAANRLKRQLQEQIRAASGASRNPRAASQLGVDVNDPVALRNRLEELRAERAELDSWPTNPAIRERIMAEAGVETSTQRQERIAQEQAEQQEAESRAEIDSGVDSFALTGSTQDADVAMAAGQNDMFVATRGDTAQTETAQAETAQAETAQTEANDNSPEARLYRRIQGLREAVERDGNIADADADSMLDTLDRAEGLFVDGELNSAQRLIRRVDGFLDGAQSGTPVGSTNPNNTAEGRAAMVDRDNARKAVAQAERALIEMSMAGQDTTALESLLQEARDQSRDDPQSATGLAGRIWRDAVEATNSMDRFRQSRLTAQDGERGMSRNRLQRFADNWLNDFGGALGIEVVVLDNPSQMDVETDFDSRTRAAYDSQNQTVYLFADSIPNNRMAQETMRHEVLAHHGIMRAMDADQAQDLLRRIMNTENSSNATLRDAWERVRRNYADASDAVVAHEVFAHVAESQPGRLGDAWNRVVAAIKSFLRRHGLMDGNSISNEELQAALQDIAANFRSNNNTNPDGPDGGQMLQSRTDDSLTNRARDLEQAMGQQADEAKNILRRAWEGLTRGGTAETVRKAAKKALTLRQFAEISEKYAPKVRDYVNLVQSMMTERNQRTHKAGRVAQEIRDWARKNKADADKLFDLMHDATLAQFDPAAVIGDVDQVEINTQLAGQMNRAKRLAREAREAGDIEAADALDNRVADINQRLKDWSSDELAMRQDLSRRFQALPESAQVFYQQMRDHHVEDNNTYHQVLLERLEKVESDPSRRKRMMDHVRFEQEFANEYGPYFPLGRKGEYVVRFDRNGEEFVYTFETEAEAEKAIDNLRKIQGIKASMNKRTEKDYKQDGASFAFMDDLLTRIASDQNLDAETRESLTRTAYQVYLSHLPDRSMRKNRLQRRGIKGYNNDALQTFANTASRNAYQLARLTHADRMNAVLNEIVTDADTPNPDVDPRTMRVKAEVANEMKQRHEWVMNPTTSKVTRGFTSVGFTYMLGVSPMAGLVNMTQTFIVGLPVIVSNLRKSGSVAGFGSVSKELVKAGSDFIAASGRLKQVGFTPEKMTTHLSQEEQDAFVQWYDSGVLDQTNAHTIMGISDSGTTEDQFSDRTEKIMKGIGWTFHSAEVMNRQVTALAAYRALRKDGRSHKEAADLAGEISWDSHFDYTNANRAPIMQSGVAKVMLQFRQFSQAMGFYLMRNLHQAFKGESAQVKRQARVQLLGTLGITGFMGGSAAMPAMWLLEGAINTVMDWGDEDEPFDARAEMRVYLAQHLGAEVADKIIFGLGGAGLSQRISLGNLAWYEPYRDLDSGVDTWAHYAAQVAGPTLGGLAIQALEGHNLFSQGEYQRGVEKIVPKFIRDPLVAYRFSQEGATTMRGDVIKGAEEFSFAALALQASGLADAQVMRQYQQNNAIRGYEKHITDRRRQAMDMYYESWVDGDERKRSRALERIQSFNNTHPSIAIRTQDLRNSIKQRDRRTRETIRGLHINRKDLRYLYDDLDYTTRR